MLLEHRGKTPDIHESAYIAPTATICGDVSIGANSRVLFGATIAAEGGPVEIGEHCIIMENAVLRGTAPHPLRIDEHVLVGPRAYVTGCTVEENVFLATGVTIFNGAILGAGTEVRINGVVHITSVLPPETLMPQLTRRYSQALASHHDDTKL